MQTTWLCHCFPIKANSGSKSKGDTTMNTIKDFTTRQTRSTVKYLPANWRMLVALATASWLGFSALAALDAYKSKETTSDFETISLFDIKRNGPPNVVLVGRKNAAILRRTRVIGSSFAEDKSAPNTSGNGNLVHYDGPRRVTVLKLNKSDLARLHAISLQVDAIDLQLARTATAELQRSQSASLWKGRVDSLKLSFRMIYQPQHPDTMDVVAKIIAIEKLIDTKIRDIKLSRINLIDAKNNNAKL